MTEKVKIPRKNKKGPPYCYYKLLRVCETHHPPIFIMEVRLSWIGVQSSVPGENHRVVVSDTQSDKFNVWIEFAKKWFIQYSIQYCFTQDSIQNIIQFQNKSADWFNSKNNLIQ